MTGLGMTDVMTDVAQHREKGTGSVFQRKRDGRWVAQVEAGFTAAGARRYITRSAPTEAQAKTALRQMRNKIAKDGVPVAGATTSIKRWADVWLPMYQQRVRPSRFTDVRGVVNRYIVPTIGSRKIDKVNPADVRAVQKACRDAGYGEATALRAHDALMVMLKAAELEGYEVRANAYLVERPKLPESDRDAIPLDDALALLKVSAARPDAARWVAALLQGMRQGECLGLTWGCVDLDGGTLDVSWQLQRLPYEDRAAEAFRVPRNYVCRRLAGAAHLVRPKSVTGRRIIPLVPWMTDALTRWQEIAPPNPHGLVWAEDGRPTRKATDRAAWFGLQDAAQVAHVEDEAGRRYTLHEARHTTATLLLEAGVDPETIKAILGHSSIVTSRGYQHVSQALARKALESVAERLRLDAPRT